ncbi:hypothetical protein PVAP13_6KG006876 [Panicum virgatum]|uniref:Uncharacterized protein n=1 Tax=Panicum virgatum TaxID=38727 RepID=A0A8T0R719_PANVG|nr:hypothetical protein PVAP13_6KG006876 [Panicum virgatum]
MHSVLSLKPGVTRRAGSCAKRCSTLGTVTAAKVKPAYDAPRASVWVSDERGDRVVAPLQRARPRTAGQRGLRIKEARSPSLPSPAPASSTPRGSVAAVLDMEDPCRCLIPSQPLAGEPHRSLERVAHTLPPPFRRLDLPRPWRIAASSRGAESARAAHVLGGRATGAMRGRGRQREQGGVGAAEGAGRGRARRRAAGKEMAQGRKRRRAHGGEYDKI